MECPRCGFATLAVNARCPHCGTWASAAWPPPPSNQPVEEVGNEETDTGDFGVREALHTGWRLLILSLLCAPPIFLPLAVWQGVLANRRSGAGAGNLLLALCAGFGAVGLGALLLWLCFGRDIK